MVRGSRAEYVSIRFSASTAPTEITPLQLVQACAERIEQLDGQTHAFVTPTLDTALQAAHQAMPAFTEPLRALRAKAALGDVVWRHAQVACEGIAVNRETDTGFALNANFAERMDPSWRPAHPEQTDATVRVLAAYRTKGDEAGKLAGLLHHFGCHPVVYWEKTAAVHGDFVGLASSQSPEAVTSPGRP